MSSYTTHGQSALDLRVFDHNANETINTTCNDDAFPGEALIGIALGSPRDGPLPPLAQEDAERYVPQKQKLSRWKSFGSLFGKRDIPRSASASPSYSSQRPPYRETASSSTRQDRNVEACSAAHSYALRAESPQERWQTSQPTSPKKMSTMGNKSLRRKISFKRSNSSKKGIHGVSRPHRNRSNTASQPRPQEASPQLPLNTEPLLQVEIPSVQLERYSVMFSNLLQPPTTSTLLYRRQAHMEELYTGDPGKMIEDTVSI